MPRHASPLAPALLASADAGTADVIALVSRRHKPVRGTHLPHAPGNSADLDVAGLLLRAATLFSEAHDVGDTIPGEADAYRAEARGYVAQAVGMLGLTEVDHG